MKMEYTHPGFYFIITLFVLVTVEILIMCLTCSEEKFRYDLNAPKFPNIAHDRLRLLLFFIVTVNKSHKKQTKQTTFFNTEQLPYQVCGTPPQPIGSYWGLTGDKYKLSQFLK